MLLVRTEYKKGVLFVRLDGRIDNERYLNKIKWLIEEFGIRFTVLNISKINNISLNNTNSIIKYKNELKKKKHHLLICDHNPLRNSLFNKLIPKIENEIDAFSLINRKDAYG